MPIPFFKFALYRLILLSVVQWTLPLSLIAQTIVDDSGQRIELKQPAARIISLAPHTTELLFSAGAGDRIVGVVEYSNYPARANRIAQIGSSSQFDFERIVQFQPDLIVGWQSGNPANLIARLKRMGFNVYLSEPRTIEEIASNVERLAVLAGTSAQAKETVSDFRQKMAQLRQRYSGKKPVTIFYEIWNDPLMTLNGEHIFSEVVELCGGKNIFSAASTLAPQVTREAVIARNPQVILASGTGSERPEWLDEWEKWQNLSAVKHNHLYFIHPDYLQRASLRLMTGAEQLCSVLESVRKD